MNSDHSVTLTPAAQATLLLTCYFGKATRDTVNPLTPVEWSQFSQWLHERGFTPVDLLQIESKPMLCEWDGSSITVERIKYLLRRGVGMALAVEKWLRAGLWIITRSDPEYPEQLEVQLKHAAPPVLFGCGDVGLLTSGRGVIVESSSTEQGSLDFAYHLDGSAVQGDEATLFRTLSGNAGVIGFLSEGLLQATLSAKWRQALVAGSLALVSPSSPGS
ncbi:hypothetical protein FGL86_05845 [Pistricoccus aurantiacus]|uniref:Uncharacterized protein n=1 Tax=Pistricoccus aurantiacus TaxID=1883414 RepID=A0A5B8SPF0_9GAMM|nr:hypothetical protein [Pistricoccus aurantiacus]QEA38646.1 hypothetical protein FGL86_05845 [Pistricoccus aurantiacus]